MSGNIKRIIKFFIYHMEIGLLAGLVLLIVFIFSQNISGTIFMTLLELLMIIVKINFTIKHIIDETVRIFSANSKVRNVDCLIIGDMTDIQDVYEEGKHVVELCAPDRTLSASYEILRHTYSILRKNGKVIITCKDKNIDKVTYSIFEIAYFHPVTIKRLHLESLKQKSLFPIVCNPFGTIQLLLNRRKKYEVSKCKNIEISEFCSIRGIELEYRRCN